MKSKKVKFGERTLTHWMCDLNKQQKVSLGDFTKERGILKKFYVSDAREQGVNEVTFFGPVSALLFFCGVHIKMFGKYNGVLCICGE